MDASCTIQDSIHVFSLIHKYVSSILGTYQIGVPFYFCFFVFLEKKEVNPVNSD